MVLGPGEDGPARGYGTGVLTEADVACWVLKSARGPGEIAPGWRAGEVRRIGRCVRRSYRLGLMRPGQRCLLWVSGRHAPGVHALGTLAVPPDGTEPAPVVELDLVLLDEPVARAELVPDPVFGTAEVIRMPAGSNPSWLSAGQWAAVADRLPPG
jgi:hypothetical protein